MRGRFPFTVFEGALGPNGFHLVYLHTELYPFNFRAATKVKAIMVKFDSSVSFISHVMIHSYLYLSFFSKRQPTRTKEKR